MKIVLLGGPRDGVELDVEPRASYVKIPCLTAEGWTTIVYRRERVLVAGTPIGDVFVHEGTRLTRAAAVQAITRLFLAGAFR